MRVWYGPRNLKCLLNPPCPPGAKAWQLAKDAGHPHAQTTPHLFSWLIFTGRLGDGDKDTVIAQHVEVGRHIAPHLQTAYKMALQCRLNSTAKS